MHSGLYKAKIHRLVAGAICLSALVGASLFTPAETKTGRPETDNTAIKRADFLVTGASCVACIRRLSWVLRHTDGVLIADVSIFKPHKAIVFYDAGKTSLDRIWASAKTDKVLKRVSVDHLKETSVERIPTVIIPALTN